MCADLPAVRRGITPQSPCGDSSPGRGAGVPPLRGEVGEQSEPGGVACTGLPAVWYTPQSPCGDSSPGRGAGVPPLRGEVARRAGGVECTNARKKGVSRWLLRTLFCWSGRGNSAGI